MTDSKLDLRKKLPWKNPEEAPAQLTRAQLDSHKAKFDGKSDQNELSVFILDRSRALLDYFKEKRGIPGPAESHALELLQINAQGIEDFFARHLGEGRPKYAQLADLMIKQPFGRFTWSEGAVIRQVVLRNDARWDRKTEHAPALLISEDGESFEPMMVDRNGEFRRLSEIGDASEQQHLGTRQNQTKTSTSTVPISRKPVPVDADEEVLSHAGTPVIRWHTRTMRPEIRLDRVSRPGPSLPDLPASLSSPSAQQPAPPRHRLKKVPARRPHPPKGSAVEPPAQRAAIPLRERLVKVPRRQARPAARELKHERWHVLHKPGARLEPSERLAVRGAALQAASPAVKAAVRSRSDRAPHDSPLSPARQAPRKLNSALIPRALQTPEQRRLAMAVRAKELAERAKNNRLRAQMAREAGAGRRKTAFELLGESKGRSAAAIRAARPSQQGQQFSLAEKRSAIAQLRERRKKRLAESKAAQALKKIEMAENVRKDRANALRQASEGLSRSAPAARSPSRPDPRNFQKAGQGTGGGKRLPGSN